MTPGQSTYDTGFLDGASSRDAEIKNWSACEAAANIPAVFEYVSQLEQERDQLREQVKLLRDIVRIAIERGDLYISDQEQAEAALAATEPKP